MKLRCTRAALLLLAMLACSPGAARAEDEDSSQSVLGRLHYGVAGGLLEGVGPQGRSLRRGPYIGFNVHGESAIGMHLGVEGAYAASQDYFETRFASLGVFARLSPTPEDYRVFVQLGGAIYHVSYDPKQPGVVSPKNKTRPGGSFGVGLDLHQSDHYSVGGLITYNGVVLAKSAARSYVVAAVTLTFKPSAY